MPTVWPSLQALELLVAVVDGGSVGGGARKVGVSRPNASRTLATLEARAGRALLERTPRGSFPTAAGLLLADHAREVLGAAQRLQEVLVTAGDGEMTPRLRVGASMTIAESLLPAWLARLRREAPPVRVDLQVLNSVQVLDGVREGALQLGFVETPHLPQGVNATVVHDDELVVVVAPDHPWAERRSRVSRAELAATPLVVREPGSGTRETLDALLANLTRAEPAQVLQSNAAVRVAVASGQAPAALSLLAVRGQLAAGELLRVPLDEPVHRPLTAVWAGPRRLTGPAGALVTIARRAGR